MAEKLIQTLQDVGAIAPADTHPTWHGRAAAPEDTTWYIDPSFHNGGKQKGRRNHCVRPALYTGSKECALTIAQQRVKQARHHTDEILIPTAHEITPDDNTAIALHHFAPHTLRDQDRKAYEAAMDTLVGVTATEHKKALAAYCIARGLPAVFDTTLTIDTLAYTVPREFAPDTPHASFTYEDIASMLQQLGVIGMYRGVRTARGHHYCVNFTDLYRIHPGERQTS